MIAIEYVCLCYLLLCIITVLHLSHQESTGSDLNTVWYVLCVEVVQDMEINV